MTATTDDRKATELNQPLWFLHNLSKVRLDAGACDGTLDVVESVGRKDEMPPLHLHRREDEYFVMLEGEITVFLPGESRRVGAGEAAFAPKDVPHTYRIESDE